MMMNPVKSPLFDRVIWIVLDGVGAGELPDAKDYHDQGANTLKNLAAQFYQQKNRPLNLPHLRSWD